MSAEQQQGEIEALRREVTRLTKRIEQMKPKNDQLTQSQ